MWGKIVDARGPKSLLISAFTLLMGGYTGIRYLYDSGLPTGEASLSALGFVILVLFSYMTGAGGNAGLVSAVNSTAKTFPDKAVRRQPLVFHFFVMYFLTYDL